MLIGLKAYKTTTFPKEDIATLFPSLLADILRMFMAKSLNGRPLPIGYNWDKFMEFQTNLGIMIAQEKFDYLDNVVIQFLKSYQTCFNPYVITICILDDELRKYENICNEFKGKTWDEIIDDFIDATYNLFKTGKFLGKCME